MEQINEFTVPEELDDERLDAVVASLSERQNSKTERESAGE